MCQTIGDSSCFVNWVTLPVCHYTGIMAPLFSFFMVLFEKILLGGSACTLLMYDISDLLVSLCCI